ncbi:MAG: penicillin-binding protein 1A [Moorea sp. SIO2B7]|nr:penicillin-binding protein 1A [Moorena sp. SIO2B7]
MSSSTISQKQQEQRTPLKSVFHFTAGVAKVTGGTILGITMLASSLVAGGLVGLAISFRNLPDIRVLRSYVPTETSYIYDIKGKPLASIHGEANREVVELEEVSSQLKRALLAIEDSHFYLHKGINPNSIGRAFLVNWEKGEVVEGGSTITMQLVKNLFLNRERHFSRKLAEAVLAIRVEQIFTKGEILEMYLNNIYWGHNNYGVQTAAESYFNKPASKLNLAEGAMMAGLIQAPEKYSPFINYKETKRRQAVVLRRMRELGWITASEEAAARKEPLLVGKPTAWQTSELPFITEAVVKELNERFGREAVVKGGMRIQTTVEYNFQQKAEEVVKRSHRNLRRRGLYAEQIALVAVDPRTHFVKAMVGGVNYDKSQYNRALEARRQPGSSFKPFVYYAAFASGKYSPYSIINDSRVSYRDGRGYYTPKNYGGGYSGPVSLRTALINSLNVPAVKLGRRVGLDKVIEVCRTLGIKSPLQPVTSLPLGAIGITPLEMAGAYATFASNGWHSDPTVIVRVTDSRGNILLDNTKPPKLVLDPWATASLTTVLKGVINGGTGKKAYIGRPAAGKTGTTSAERDVWFVGYVPQLATAVWIGNDNYFRTLGRGVTGGGHAAPVWRRFMRQALKNEPVKRFPSASKFPRPRR